MEIVSTSPEFDFKTITLADPQPLHGHAGFYFTQLSVGGEEKEKKALCLQLPECLTKQGIVNIKNSKYLDLMFERANSDELTRWIEQLEYTCQDIIDAKKELWFQTELTRDDIETMMTQVTRLYQSGKYMLMRVFVETTKPGQNCIAYDENEIGFDLELLEPNKPLIPLIMIEGVKFSSRSFEIVLKLVQVMIIGKVDKKSTCLIKRHQEVTSTDNLEVIKDTPRIMTTVNIEPAKLEPAKLKPAKLEPAKLEPAKLEPAKLVTVTHVDLVKPISNHIKPPCEMEEITIDYDEVADDSISLKNPNDVYYELYRKAREKAKQCRMAAIEAYLEAKQIKTKYMLFEDDDSDISDESDNVSDNED